MREDLSFNGKSSPAHGYFLTTFLVPRRPDDYFQGIDWQAVLGEPPQKAMERFLVSGLLDRASLPQKMDAQFTVAELKEMLRQQNLSMGGKKSELIVRFIQAKPDLAAETTSIELYQCSNKGQQLAEQCLQRFPNNTLDCAGSSQKSDSTLPKWWSKIKDNLLTLRILLILNILVVTLELANNFIGTAADYSSAERQFIEWGVIPPCRKATENEFLIIIPTFYSSGIDNEPHNAIRQGIEEETLQLDFPSLQIQVIPYLLRAGDQVGAENLGKSCNASMVIWGENTGERIIINFLNISAPQFRSADENTINPQAGPLDKPYIYTELITSNSSESITFFSLFAIGQSYYLEGEYEQAIKQIEAAIVHFEELEVEDHKSSCNEEETKSLQGVETVYFFLGWLLQFVGKYEEANSAYANAIALNNHLLDAVSQNVKVMPPAILIAAPLFNNEGEEKYKAGDFEAALSNFNAAIENNPIFAEAYVNLGDTFREIVKVYNRREDALCYTPQEAFNKALINYKIGLKLDPNLPNVYRGLGYTYFWMGDCELAKQYLNDYLDWAPGAEDREKVEGILAQLECI